MVSNQHGNRQFAKHCYFSGGLGPWSKLLNYDGIISDGEHELSPVKYHGYRFSRLHRISFVLHKNRYLYNSLDLERT